MERKVAMSEISDGRLYRFNDMVKADCNDCKGCFACCQGMGDSIVLDPFDICRLSWNLKLTFEELLAEHIELHVVDGLILPNLKMSGEEERCSFLNGAGRCSIHRFRPGICRLFPLGRFYENRGFQYFLQVHECKNEKRTKVKVRKWIDMPDGKRYEQFISDWHYFLKDLQEKLKETGDEAAVKEASMYVLKNFYLLPYEEPVDFYDQFERRLAKAGEEVLGSS